MDKRILYLCFFYLLSNAIMLLNNGVFWDDWALFNMSFEGIMEQFNGNGLPFYGHVHFFLQKFSNPPLVYNILTIVLQLLTAILSWEIVKSITKEKNFFFLIILLATIIPFFSAKNTMICFPYVVNYFAFTLGFYSLILFLKKDVLIFRLFAVFLFLFSFTVNSFLFFYLIPFLVLYFYKGGFTLEYIKDNWKKPFSFIRFKPLLKSIDFLLLPFVFLLIKSVFLKPTGLYAASNYNEITIFGMLKAPLLVISSFMESFVGLFSEFYGSVFGDKYLLIFFFVIFFFTFFLFRKNLKEFHITKTNLYIYLIIGLCVFFIGSYPYCTVHKIPSFNSYDTRHQLLLPIGSALILVSSLFLLFKVEFRNIVFSLIVSSFVCTTFANNLQFIKGWLKQESMQINFGENDEMKKNHTFLLYDKCEEFDATAREYSFYALNGMAKNVFDAENKLICEFQEYQKHQLRGSWEKLLSEAEKFNMKNYKFSEPRHLITIDNGAYRLTTLNTLKLAFAKLIGRPTYKQETKIIKFEVVEFDYDYLNEILYDIPN